MQKKSNAQTTFDQVIRRLSIVEKEYFALEYEDEQKNLVSMRVYVHACMRVCVHACVRACMCMCVCV